MLTPVPVACARIGHESWRTFDKVLGIIAEHPATGIAACDEAASVCDHLLARLILGAAESNHFLCTIRAANFRAVF